MPRWIGFLKKAPTHRGIKISKNKVVISLEQTSDPKPEDEQAFASVYPTL